MAHTAAGTRAVCVAVDIARSAKELRRAPITRGATEAAVADAGAVAAASAIAAQACITEHTAFGAVPSSSKVACPVDVARAMAAAAGSAAAHRAISAIPADGTALAAAAGKVGGACTLARLVALASFA